MSRTMKLGVNNATRYVKERRGGGGNRRESRGSRRGGKGRGRAFLIC